MALKIAYIVDGYLDSVTKEDAEMLTHINIAFGVLEDGKVKTSHLKNTAHIARIRQMNPRIKIILSVGGWGAGGFSNACLTEEGRERLAASAAEACEKLALDGMDIDWEYPCMDEAEIDASPEDKKTFTLLLKRMRELLPEGKLLTIAAGGGAYFLENTEMPEVVKYLDYVQLMTYDLTSGGTTVHHTNLRASNPGDKKSNVEYCVDIFNKGGVPFEKIVIGAAFYSRKWENVINADSDGLHQKSKTPVAFGPGFTELHENYIDKNGFKRYWDKEACAPYLFNGKVFLTYDDEESIKLKCKLVQEKNLLGIMYWEHSCDETRLLLKAIADEIG